MLVAGVALLTAVGTVLSKQVKLTLWHALVSHLFGAMIVALVVKHRGESLELTSSRQMIPDAPMVCCSLVAFNFCG